MLIEIMFCLLCFNFSQIHGFLDAEKALINNKDPYYKQSKLLISNNYNELMTIYDPVWLANLWPKLRNGAHLNLEDYCWKNLTVFFQDMLDGRAWALNSIDSTGSFSSGLLWGNRYWIGSQEECDDLDSRYKDLKYNSTSNAFSHLKYVSSLSNGVNSDGKQSRRDLINPEVLSKMILLDNTPPYNMRFSAITLYLNITKTTLYSSHAILMGVCLPKACRSHDIHELIDFSIKTYQNLRVSGTLPRSARVSKVRVLNSDYNVLFEPKLYFLCSILLILIVLITIGTIMDVNIYDFESYTESDIQTTPPTFKSFLKMEPLDLEEQINTNDNIKIGIKNDDQAAVHLSQLSDQKSLESFHTFDGLIPNRYTELSGFNFIDNSERLTINNLSNKSHLNLVSVKKVIKNENAPTITLDIIAMKSSNNRIDLEPRHYCKKQKYVVSSDKESSTGNIFNYSNRPKFLESCNCINRDTYWAKILVCFSLKLNFEKIFSLDIGEDTLAPIHGMKLITILWVILVHTCLVVYQFSDNKVYRGKVEKNFLYQTIGNGTYSVDTFFTLSGVLIAYLYCQTMKKYLTTNSGDFSGVFGKSVQFITMISYRYIRLSPPYLLTIGLLELVSKHFNAHYILELPGMDHINCEKFWWRNALYINTFYPLKEACMSWSWYLANDSQFYLIGILILMLAVRHLKTSIVFFVMFLVIGWTTTAIITLKTGYIPSIEDPFSHYDELYNKPWTRIGPYMVGLACGWILSKTNCCILISKKISILLWIISITILLSVVYGLYGNHLGTYGSIAYASFSHTAWGMAISWILIACVTGYGGRANHILSWQYLYPFSRLSYCAYLLHPLLLKIILIPSGAIQHISPETMLTFYLGFVLITYLSALICSLLFEAPVVSLLRLIHPMRISPEKEDN